MNQEAWLYTIAERKLTCFAEHIVEDLPDESGVVRLIRGDELAFELEWDLELSYWACAKLCIA